MGFTGLAKDFISIVEVERDSFYLREALSAFLL